MTTLIHLRNTPKDQAPVAIPRAVRRKLARQDLLMQVRIDPPPSNPNRLTAGQQHQLDRLIAAMKDRVNVKVTTAAENPGLISSHRRSKMIDDQILVPTAEPLPIQEQPKKKRGGRRPRLNGTGTASAQLPEAAGKVYLTPEQLSRLWQAVTGGEIFISGATNITISVTLDSFRKALPVLLEKL